MKAHSATGGPAARRLGGGGAVGRLDAVTDTALAHLSLDELLDELLVRVQRLLGADTAAILLREGDVLVPRAAKGLEEGLTEGIRVPLGEGFSGRVAAEQRPIVLENATRAELVNQVLRRRGVRSLLGVPLLFEGGVIGVLHVGTLRRRRFSRADAQLLQVVADRIALGIAYARLWEEERRARAEAERERERSRLLANVSALFSTSLDFDATLGNLARLLVPALGDCCLVDLLEDGDRLRRIQVCADPAKQAALDEVSRRYPPRADRPADVTVAVRAGTPLAMAEIPDTLWDALAEDDEHARLVRALGFRSLLVVPLAARGDIIGAITLIAAESGRRYGEADLPLAQELARRAGLAVDNARLYREAHEARERLARQAARQHALAEASRVFAEASLDLDAVLDTVVRHLGERIGDVCGIRLISSDDESPGPVALYHPDPDAAGALRALAVGFPARAGDGITNDVMRTGGGVLLPAVDPEWLRRSLLPAYQEYAIRFPVHSLLGVPLRVQGRVTGVLVLARLTAGRPYDVEDQRLLQDLADRAALEIESARLYRAAQEAHALTEAASRAKDDFLATVSHELRTPLTPILVWTRMLRGGQLDEATTRQAIDTIERSARSQAQLVEDLLDVSRIIAGKLRLNVAPTDLAAVVETALESVRPAADAKGIDLTVDVAPGVPPVSGDPDRLQQVVWNLLANATKFTPDGGRVRLAVRRAGGAVELEVRDDGKGIRRDFLPYLFERFRQGDSSSTRPHGGLGLGLAIVRHLVELHGGTVRADSAGEGQGAVFTVRLPVGATAGRTAVTPTEPRPEPAPAILRGVRVLVVDDELDTCEAVKAILGHTGAEVHACGSAREALDELARWPPDVLMSDIGMPGEDGYTLIRKVRAREGAGPRVPAVALTAYARREDSERALAEGYQMHLPKPVDPDALIAAVARAAGRGIR